MPILKFAYQGFAEKYILGIYKYTNAKNQMNPGVQCASDWAVVLWSWPLVIDRIGIISAM